MITTLTWLLTQLVGYCLAQYTDPHCGGKQVIVHLFEWKWTDIALECERFLSKKGFCGVQVSPANEHVMVTSPPRPWWERYQPVSYKLQSRSGTEAEFADMVSRCKAVGVRIYVDVILNHMAGLGRNGTGTAGSTFNSDLFDFPGVPYIKEHFNEVCPLNSYNDAHTIKDCYLVGLTDLDQNISYVRDKIAAFLNTLIDYGVAGFRVDAAKHMWTKDIAAIQQNVKDLPEGGRPFFYHEVIDQSNGPVTTQQYTSLGYVTEFRYCQKIKEGIEGFDRLGGVVDYGWGMTDSDHAFVFVDNHDNQRGHGGGGAIITFEKPINYRLAVAFTLANDYGFTRVMSSYYFGENSDLGPPHDINFLTKDVPFNADESCGNEWVCEHRWASIANMVAFRNAVVGTQKQNYFNKNNQIAFSRGNKGFFAMSRSGHMDETLQTGLPAGQYRDLINGRMVTVGSDGTARIQIDNPQEPVLAIIIGSDSPALSTSIPATAQSVSTVAGVSVSSPTEETTTPGNDVTTSVDAGTTPDGATTTSGIESNVTTMSPTGSTSGPSMSRTVILMEKQTRAGEDLFIRGGLDVDTHPGCMSDASACSIPISDRPIGNGPHYGQYNAWRVGDHFLDWSGAEPGQGTVNGIMAQGTPAVWTTNNPNHPGHSQFNEYGDHYWLVDIDMDCSRTQGGWFEFKAVLNGQWEHDIYSDACTGSGAGSTPAQTQNHWAKCGMLNIYHFGANTCEIENLS
ncbi:alpha-amylase A-like [Dreissena polymorpha]|uniref:Alpha-amylase n=1 Tax=Dreissena polymorpha TaxID=45954 RepID=A0A9D4LAY1_DREPO|nr:alpha-amylase A-like [Dreissena polymorpha]KAH3853812.1 hypothetical protein DPMN_096347 [Dreissena polymorpha]